MNTFISLLDNYRRVALFLLAIAPVIALGQSSEAVSDAERLIAKNAVPDSVFVKNYTLVAQRYYRSNRERAFDLIDSAQTVALKHKDPYEIGLVKNAYGTMAMFGGQIDSAMSIYDEVISIAREIQHDQLLGLGLLNMGTCYYFKSNLDSAVFFFNQAQKQCQKAEDFATEIKVLNNLAMIKLAKENYRSSIDYFVESLTIAETIGDNAMANQLNLNIASIYINMSDNQMGLNYLNKAYPYAKKEKIQSHLSVIYINKAAVFERFGKLDSALLYIDKGVLLKRELKDVSGLAIGLVTQTEVYRKLGRIRDAQSCIDEATEIFKTVALRDGIFACMVANGQLMLAREEIKEGLNKLNEAFAYADSNNLIGTKSEALKSAATSLYESNQFQLAFDYLIEHNEIMDSITATGQREYTEELNKKYETEKREFEIQNLQKESKINQQRIEKESIQKMSFGVGFLLMIIIAFVLFKSYRNKKKDNEIIATQKQQVEQKQQETQRQKQEIEKQKAVLQETHAQLAEHHKEIADSINYAKRIQFAILPPDNLIKKHLPNSFFLFKPKDVVSGDFYWMEAVGDLTIFAAADCTGHGVPGAMVSVVCVNALNRSVREFGLTDPGKILDKTRKLVIETFEKSDQEVKDGMDISLCALNTATKQLKWAGANNPLYHIKKRDGQETEKSVQNETHYLEEIKADRQPIGKYSDETPFTSNEINLSSGDLIVISTDGYADQFGGLKGKKFKYKPFKQLLLNNMNMPLDQQKEELIHTFNIWKGELEQIDDVCIIGVAIN